MHDPCRRDQRRPAGLHPALSSAARARAYRPRPPRTVPARARSSSPRLPARLVRAGRCRPAARRWRPLHRPVAIPEFPWPPQCLLLPSPRARRCSPWRWPPGWRWRTSITTSRCWASWPAAWATRA
ncbi:hypothetical protein C9J98_03835 [Stenotrophomonas panacihumi]|nr:hypothetical protein C9J98_03835 [Stenotrophomonas panacihumi]